MAATSGISAVVAPDGTVAAAGAGDRSPATLVAEVPLRDRPTLADPARRLAGVAAGGRRAGCRGGRRRAAPAPAAPGGRDVTGEATRPSVPADVDAGAGRAGDHPDLQRARTTSSGSSAGSARAVPEARRAGRRRRQPGRHRRARRRARRGRPAGARAAPGRQGGPRARRTSPASGGGCERGYDVVVEMDADGSHQPEQLPRLLAALARRRPGARLALGARRLGGQLAGAPASCSRAAATSTSRLALGLGVRDATGGYRAFRRSTLEGIDLDGVASQGYCFQIDLAWRTVQPGLPGRRGADRVRRAGARRLEDERRDRRARRCGGSPCGAGGPVDRVAGPDAGRAAAQPGRRQGAVTADGLGLWCVAFLVVPVVEIYVIVQVGQEIGAAPTVLLLIVESLLGAWMLKREGGRAWRGAADEAARRPASCRAASWPTPRWSWSAAPCC